MVADINVTPMVDIMLVLLIIFMVITPMLQKGVSVDMAKATNPREMREADQDDAVVVAVTRDGKIYLGSDQLLAWTGWPNASRICWPPKWTRPST